MPRVFSIKAATVGALSGISALVAIAGACSSQPAGGGVSGTPSSSGGSPSAPCATVMQCQSPSLDVLFSPMYSAYIADDNDAHSFQIPAIVNGIDNSAVTWGVSDTSAVTCTTDTGTGGVMITVQKAGNVTIVAQAGGKCGQSVLNVTAATDSQWQAGNARYNSGVPIYGGCIGLGQKNYPDGGPSSCPTQGPACIDCHGAGPKNQFFNDVLHTPEQVGGFSDQQLIGIFADGIVPDGGYYNSSIVSELSFSVFHKWADIQGPEQEAMVVYLRSLTPISQGNANFGGGNGSDDGGPDDSGGGDSTTPPGEVTSPTCGAEKCTAGDVCCVQPADKTDAGLVGTCGAASSCTGFALACSQTPDCPSGQVCCGDLGGTPATSSCQSSCSSSEDQLCADVAECPSGDGCRGYPYGDGIKVCLVKDGDGGKGKKDGSP
ncbi:MAG: hypothetical protein ACLQVI_26925 [Polyangiaceae bacterium]|jgi:hypothetical protein